MAATYTITVNTLHADVERLVGWSIRETAATALSLRLRENDAAGRILASIRLGANGSETVSLVHPLTCSGVYVEVVSGSMEGALYSL